MNAILHWYHNAIKASKECGCESIDSRLVGGFAAVLPAIDRCNCCNIRILLFSNKKKHPKHLKYFSKKFLKKRNSFQAARLMIDCRMALRGGRRASRWSTRTRAFSRAVPSQPVALASADNVRTRHSMHHTLCVGECDRRRACSAALNQSASRCSKWRLKPSNNNKTEERNLNTSMFGIWASSVEILHWRPMIAFHLGSSIRSNRPQRTSKFEIIKKSINDWL